MTRWPAIRPRRRMASSARLRSRRRHVDPRRADRRPASRARCASTRTRAARASPRCDSSRRAAASSRQPHERGGQRVGVVGIDRFGGAAGNLVERRGVRGDHRRAAGHGFDHRQAEALVERRKRRTARRGCRCAGRSSTGTYPVKCTTLRSPSRSMRPSRSRDDQPYGPTHTSSCAHPLRRAPRERSHQPRQVLPRLDRADVQNKPIGQPVARADAVERARAVGDRLERRAAASWTTADPIGVDAVQPQQIAARAVRDGHDRRRARARHPSSGRLITSRRSG